MLQFYSFTVLQLCSGFLSNICMWRISQQSFQFTISFITHYSYFTNCQQWTCLLLKKLTVEPTLPKAQLYSVALISPYIWFLLWYTNVKPKNTELFFSHYVKILYILGLMHIDSVMKTQWMQIVFLCSTHKCKRESSSKYLKCFRFIWSIGLMDFNRLF